MAVARITGLVLGVDERSGTKVYEDGSTKPWTMTSARVLVGGEDVTKVGLPDRIAADVDARPDRGDTVDWLVQVGVGGRFLNIDLIGDWPGDEQSAGLSSVEAFSA